MIAVFDTNVLIAAIITEGVCAKLLHRTRSREFSLVSCPFIMTEIRRILSKKFRLSRDETALAMEPIIEAIDHVIKHNVKITDICRDADDDNVLACALAAKAAYLVTGDADLLVLKNFRGVKIISPRDFEALFD
ncbi:MAG: putative toxin-antitoxin system toxin component, PIN family [Nitrospira bacterium HGW-Nitrospira-1]|nr:MAG: putative toxin-antitoxin system toxin component, PIN family [Nitrospira bacterium HGW-Nitrospira-1]